MNDVSAEALAGIAVIGMVGRFPGAKNLSEYWQNLCNGVESIRFFQPSELDPGLNQEDVENPDYVLARGLMADADKFDAAFFGISAREAELMDPQNRVFLQMAWESLEQAGYSPEGFDGMISVYAGMANNSYYPSSVLPRPGLVKRLGEFQTMLANEKDFLATRVSHKLNLTGPSVSLYTGCSTSLVAICHAFNSLLSFQSDMALAGGISITCPQKSGYLYKEDGIESVDGHCRPFDGAASGTIFSDGAGIVVLKRLEDALQDRDHIHAVIRGAAMNNDGAAKVSFAAPSVQGQADVISMALSQADINPQTVGFVEAHGTATRLGDPIEFEGLKRAFQYPRHGAQYCALGSVKSNFGHVLAAAGVAGFIKTVMALENRKIPATLHFNRANPEIDLDNSPFYINTSSRDWAQTAHPRRAGVSSFGIGGTNAHVVIEEAPAQKRAKDDVNAAGIPRIFLLSTRNQQTLDRASDNLQEFVRDNDVSLANTAFTLHSGRRTFPHRLSVVASSAAELNDRIKSRSSQWCLSGICQSEDPDIVFMFPGQGTQYIGMGQSLYQQAPVYKEWLDKCAHIVLEYGRFDIRQPVHSDYYMDEARENTTMEQCTLFATEYALTQWLISLGIKPKTLIGHSVGEWVAACVSGVISLEDALRALLGRGAAYEKAPAGLMLAVRLPAAKLNEFCIDTVCVAADNAPNLSTAAGSSEGIEFLEQVLSGKSIPHRRLAATRAFHSPLMHSSISEALSVSSTLRYSRPRIPIVSTVTGNWINPQAVTDPAYWSRHSCEPVKFKAAVETAANNKHRLFLEVGPGNSLSSCVAQTLGSEVRTASLFPDQWQDSNSEYSSVLMGLSRLWHQGVAIKWDKLLSGSEQRIPLPGYPFEATRFWLDAVARSRWLVPADE